MSQLWNQIGQARRDHLTSCYPGDLAAEVLPLDQRQASRVVLFRGLRAAGAVAAAVMVAWFWPDPFVSPLRAAGVLPPSQDAGIEQVDPGAILPAVPQFPGWPDGELGGD